MVAKDDYILRACQNVTYRAVNLQQYDVEINYKENTKFVQEKAYQIYAYLRHKYYRHVKENPFEINVSNALNIRVNFDNMATAFNTSINSTMGRTEILNAPIQEWQRYAFISNPRSSPIDRFLTYELPLYYKRKLTSFT